MNRDAATKSASTAAGQEQQQQQQQQQEQQEQTPPLYFSVVYADNRVAMFNIACQKDHLVSAIRKRCRLERGTKIELSSVKGELLNIPGRKDSDSLTECISSRDTFVLCKLEDSKHPNVEARLVPLIDTPEEFPELQQLAEAIEQRVADKEARLAQKQSENSKRSSQQQQQQQQQAASSEASGATKGRQALRKLMLINKMKRRA